VECPWSPSNEDFLVGVIFIGYAIVSSFNTYYLGVFRAKGKFNYEFNTSLSNAFLISVFIVLAILNHWSIVILSVLLVVSKTIHLLITVLTFHFKFYQKDLFIFNWDIQKYLLKNSWSFGLHFIIGTLYFQVDTQMLNYFCGNEAVGLYQAPFKLIMMLLISYDVIFQVFTPHLAEQYKKLSLDSLNDIISKLLKYIITSSIIAFGTIVIFYNPIINLIFGQAYIKSAPILPVLAAVVVVRVIASVYGILLTIGNYQNYRAKAVLISLIITLTLNYIFIPLYGIYGAAVVSLLTHLALLLIYLVLIQKQFKSSLITLRSKYKLALSGIVLILFWTNSYTWVLIAVSILLAVYSITDFDKRELKSVIKY